MIMGLEGFCYEVSTIEKMTASQGYSHPRGGNEQLTSSYKKKKKNILEAYLGTSINSCSCAYLVLQKNSNKIGIIPC